MANNAELDYENQLLEGPDGPDPAVVPIHPSLYAPSSCRNCGQREENGTVWPLPGGGHALLLQVEMVAPRELILEGRSCVTCVGEVYYITRHLRDEALAGSGGDTPFHHAARTGNLRMVYYLIKFLLDLEGAAHGVRIRALKKAVRRRNDRDETALHTAVGAGDNAIVELLMWAHPELGQMTCLDISPIYQAVSLGREDIAEAMRDISQNFATALSYSGPNGQNALHAAVLQKGDMTRMILGWNNLLAEGKDENGSTPLHFAVSMGDPRPLLIICWYPIRRLGEAVSSVTQILGADPSLAYERDKEGLFPVHVAAMTNKKYSIGILLNRCPGCLGLRDNQGRTFLHVAVQRKAGSVVQYVCRTPEFAPILNVQDNNGNTALHLAVNAQDLSILSHLLRNREVLLNLKNNESQTALDLAKSRIREGFYFAGALVTITDRDEVMFLQNPDKVIYRTLVRVGAQHGCFRWSKLTATPAGLVETEKRKEDDLESAKMGDSSRTLGIGSVLIASVSFTAAVARPPGGSGADNNTTARSSANWHFDAFMVADALAFIFASAATIGLMYSGMAMVKLGFRRVHFNFCLFLLWTAVKCFVAAFALGVYMVLAPVAPPATAITIFAFCSLVVISRYVQDLYIRRFLAGVLCARKGFWTWLKLTVPNILLLLLFEFWPFAVIFLWAAPSTRKHVWLH
ncbi:hypothetical protein U9M48_029403 [Paspalum notatum var. saurae]|uniref:PGG domain-containing protein n=1 Tax=Paspalum notatum var. saurae TaxID=547442 RepID=A0AAQ3X226_PASNO